MASNWVLTTVSDHNFPDLEDFEANLDYLVRRIKDHHVQNEVVRASVGLWVSVTERLHFTGSKDAF